MTFLYTNLARVCRACDMRDCDSEKENQKPSHRRVKNANPEKPPDQFLFLDKLPEKTNHQDPAWATKSSEFY